MDHYLLEVARQSGCALMQPARAENVRPQSVHVRDLNTNLIRELSASWVLLCDGKPPRGSLRAMSAKAHFDGVLGRRDAISLFGMNESYVGLAPVELDRWNVALTVPAEIMHRHRGDLDAMFKSMLDQNPEMASRFGAARALGRWVAAPLPRSSVRDDWPAGMIPIGNAVAAIEPVGGEGIGLAMRSAELAAAALIAARREERTVDVAALRRSFLKLWQMRSAGCRAAGLAVSRPRLASYAAPIIDQTESLRRLALQLTGKIA
jgi:2-polyprenyl-6-methoxyphenol hydroxylase-like FAD-dependent oxidoreductase